MLPRQRVMDALSHKPTDRVPLDFWSTPEMWDKLKAYFQTDSKSRILQALHIDIRDYRPQYVGPALRTGPDDSYYEPLGTHRRKVKNQFATYEEYASAPLGYVESVADFDDYAWWPNAEDYDFAGMSREIGDVCKTYATRMMVGGLFELAWALRGYEQFMMDMIVDPDIPHFIMNKLTEFYCAYIESAMSNAKDQIDIIFSCDDIACQNGLLLSIPMWEEFIKPYHVRMNRVAKKYGKKILYHTCGDCYHSAIIDGLMDMGIDILNPIQKVGDPDLDLLKARYGDRLCFHGGIDIQRVLPFYTPEQIRGEVERVVHSLGKNGGLILASTHFIQNDTPIENVIEMYRSASGLPIEL